MYLFHWHVLGRPCDHAFQIKSGLNVPWTKWSRNWEKKPILSFSLFMYGSLVCEWIWFFLHYFPRGHVCLSGSCGQLHSCRDLSAFSHLPEAWEMHSLSSSSLYSPHGSGFVACWSMGSPSFCPFLVFSPSAARLQIHCAISVFCNPAARFPSQLPLGTYKNKFAQSSTLWPTLSSSTNLDFIIISWPQYKSMAQTGKLDFQILTNRQQMLRPQTKGLQIYLNRHALLYFQSPLPARLYLLTAKHHLFL